MIYSILRVFGIKFCLIEKCFTDLNCFSRRRVHPWCLSIAEEENPMIVLRDKRGGYQKEDFYTMYPDIEEKASAFSIAETSKKNVTFYNKDSCSIYYQTCRIYRKHHFS